MTKKTDSELKRRRTTAKSSEESSLKSALDKRSPSESIQTPPENIENITDSNEDIPQSLEKSDETLNETEEKTPTDHIILEEKTPANSEHNNKDTYHKLQVTFDVDLISSVLFIIAICTRFYKLYDPNNVVFDELHFGKYVSLYVKRTFFFDQHPPLGKQLIAVAAHIAGYNGNYTFSRIGGEYTDAVPIFWLRTIPALCGSFLAPLAYKILLQLKCSVWTATTGGLLIIFENALLTQSRFILMEPMLLSFSILAIYMLLKYQESHDKLHRITKLKDRTKVLVLMLWYAVLSAIFFTCAVCVKYAAFYTCLLAIFIGCRHFWQMLGRSGSDSHCPIGIELLFRMLTFSVVPLIVYLTIFWIHLRILNRAGPHDSVMTSAFQASLKGGLASITQGQPLEIVHGSQITLRHTHGRTCWLHSHAHVYPIRYVDKRGSSHQQQVTCYSFKDVNNWWIVKRPDRSDLVVDSAEMDMIKHGDVVQFVHGITSRALNSHDVAAPLTPHSQEVSCYIDYNISMPAQSLWKVDIINRAQEGDVWHSIKSQVRLIHTNTGAALRFSGRQLPDWGFNQHEVVADRNIEQINTIWNVEEHRYTKTSDQRERERQMVHAEMIPIKPTTLTFAEKFAELQYKMLWSQQSTDVVQSHMYSSEPMDWPLMSKGVAYWIDSKSNAQIHLLGNIVIWYSGTFALVAYIVLLAIYLLRRRRLCYDINAETWSQFCTCGEILFAGYFIHFLPYFFVERSMFLHNYLPALMFKILLLCFVIEHLYKVICEWFKSRALCFAYIVAVIIWLLYVVYVFKQFSILSYGVSQIDGRTVSADDILSLRWKDTWDFILHKELA